MSYEELYPESKEILGQMVELNHPTNQFNYILQLTQFRFKRTANFEFEKIRSQVHDFLIENNFAFRAKAHDIENREILFTNDWKEAKRVGLETYLNNRQDQTITNRTKIAEDYQRDIDFKESQIALSKHVIESKLPKSMGWFKRISIWFVNNIILALIIGIISGIIVYFITKGR